ncbi:MAG TPA: hypothetical protein PLG31_04960 [Spirochaetota bacterium]|nr:hypothetical protein [Spirochaetota bacterium]
MDGAEILLRTGGGHCIEWAAKREYRTLVDRLIANAEREDPDAEARLALLLEFLEQADFAALRSSDEYLSGEKEATCLLWRDERGVPRVYVLRDAS